MIFRKTIKESVSELKDGPYEYLHDGKTIRQSDLKNMCDNYPSRPEWTRYCIDKRDGTITEEIGSRENIVVKRIGGWKF